MDFFFITIVISILFFFIFSLQFPFVVCSSLYLYRFYICILLDVLHAFYTCGFFVIFFRPSFSSYYNDFAIENISNNDDQ